MNKTNNIIIIPFSLLWSWSADYERKTVLTLAQKGFTVIAYLHKDAHFFLKTNKSNYQKIRNIIFFKPLYLIPLKKFPLIEKINQFINLKYLIFKHGQKKKIILWIFDPIFSDFSKFVRRETISLYDCVDYIGSLNPKKDKLLKDKEQGLINITDYFFVNSHVLKNIHMSKNKKPHLVSQGFSIDYFRNPIKTKTIFDKTKPLVGFVGSIDYRFDFNLLFEVIENNPDLNFVFWGPINIQNCEDTMCTRQKYIDKLLSYKNVSYGKSDDRREIPNIIKQFDICMIPYDIKQKVNKYCYPMKIFEYFYMGKPVISTSILELKRFPKFVKIGSNSKEWERHIRYFLQNKWQSAYKREQQKLAIENSWNNKISKILSYLLLNKA